MKRGNSTLVLCLFGILPVVWLGLLIAPAAHGGLPEIVARFPAAMSDPFHIELCEDSLKTVRPDLRKLPHISCPASKPNAIC